MASSLVARRTSIAKLLKPYYPSSSSGCAGLFSLASRNPNRELDNSSASIVPGGREESRAPISTPGAAVDPIRKAVIFGGGGPRAAFGPISLLDQKARLSSSAAYDPDKYNDIQCIMKSLHSKSKVLVALTLVDLVGLASVSHLTPGSSTVWDPAASTDVFAIMVAFAYGMRFSLKSPDFAELNKLKPFFKAVDFAAIFSVITVAYSVLKSAVRLDTLLA